IINSKIKQLSFDLYDKLKLIDQDLFNTELGWQVPQYIKDNMIHTLRYYQEDALRYFHYLQVLQEFKYDKKNHVLFNMATGSGKKDLIESLILYFYIYIKYKIF